MPPGSRRRTTRNSSPASTPPYQHDPGFYTAGPYTALLIIEEALKATGGNTDDAAAFLKAMRDVRLTHGPIGPVRLDEYGTPILDIYIRKVERA